MPGAVTDHPDDVAPPAAPTAHPHHGPGPFHTSMALLGALDRPPQRKLRGPAAPGSAASTKLLTTNMIGAAQSARPSGNFGDGPMPRDLAS